MLSLHKSKSTVKIAALCLIFLFSLNSGLSFGAEKVVKVKGPVHIQLGFVQKDSVKMFTAKVLNTADSAIKGVEVHFYVQRLFGQLPVKSTLGNAKTDAKGETSMILPKKGFNGDSVGNITVIAKIEDDDDYGSVETSSVMKVGVPLVMESVVFPRALWSPRAPIPLILTFVFLIGGVWCTYSYVFYVTSKIKKAGIKKVPA